VTFIDLARQRRSVRRYAQKPVEPETVDLLVEAALRAPSSRGLTPWEFVVVTDPNLLAELSRAKPHGASFLKSAPLGIVVCADPAKCDVWIEDASIATAFIHLAAASLGLGSCWIQIRGRSFDEKQSSSAYVAERLNLPPGHEVEAIVAIGYPLGRAEPHPREDLQLDKVSYNRYGGKR
jgi:nitroreductase